MPLFPVLNMEEVRPIYCSPSLQIHSEPKNSLKESKDKAERRKTLIPAACSVGTGEHDSQEAQD